MDGNDYNDQSDAIAPFTEFIPDKSELSQIKIHKVLVQTDKCQIGLCTIGNEQETKYAIKIMNRETFEINEFNTNFRRLLREVQYMAQCRHPTIIELISWNIISYFDFNLESVIEKSLSNESASLQFCPFIITPYYEEGTLDDFLSQEKLKDFSFTDKSILCYALIRGCLYLHYFQLVIRNICPKNIFMKDKKPIFSDLFTVKNVNSDMSGTVYDGLYRAPEFYASIDGYTTKTDVYALGIVLLQIMENIKTNELPDFKHNKISKHISDDNPYKGLIMKMTAEADARIEMNSVAHEFEILFSKSSQHNDVDAFNEYKKMIDEYERKNGNNKQISTYSRPVQNALKSNEVISNLLKLTTISKENNHIEPQACFLMALNYIDGNFVARDEVLALKFLEIAKDNSVLEASILHQVFSEKSQYSCELENLYGNGCLENCLKMSMEEKEKAAESFYYAGIFDELGNDIDSAIQSYKKSLTLCNKKMSGLVAGRLGYLIMKYKQQQSGLQILKFGVEMKDMFSMVNYGTYLADIEKYDEAMKVFRYCEEGKYYKAADYIEFCSKKLGNKG
ncbi:hypothetical protein TRFO_30597 [Tritrichomonas foetus]|uniref:non-specific serine/threonine protein kinase n=1 Tax=Tritrichomonas foetus TaxID=1144522 RepID=A0A1J4JT87_9EUKA|nr:hypothetical protein TRFO_30597 [Tritrichomonas foetus]|eukprot:OHT02283.1 hypothetical protein TRFO_30597 [Tritrichomonas foetus]